MASKKRSELEQLVVVLNNRTGDEYEIISAYGQPRLYRNGGSTEVSPRLPTKHLMTWIHAYLAGFEAAMAKVELPTRDAPYCESCSGYHDPTYDGRCP